MQKHLENSRKKIHLRHIALLMRRLSYNKLEEPEFFEDMLSTYQVIHLCGSSSSLS